jgi:hypothetical protein
MFGFLSLLAPRARLGAGALRFVDLGDAPFDGIHGLLLRIRLRRSHNPHVAKYRVLRAQVRF